MKTLLLSGYLLPPETLWTAATMLIGMMTFILTCGSMKDSPGKEREFTNTTDDVRIDHFISMSELDLFFQFLPPSFWKKVVTASNAYAAKVLSTPFTSIVLFCCLLQYVESQDGMSSVVYTLPVMYKLLRLILLYALRGGVPGGIPFRSMWSTSSYIGVDAARKIMARDEALTYLRYLHLPAEGEGKNNKVNIMITTLRDNCLRNVRPGPVRPLLLVICLPLTFSTSVLTRKVFARQHALI